MMAQRRFSFDTEIAQKVGVSAAAMYDFLCECCRSPDAITRRKDGVDWVRVTFREMTVAMPFFNYGKARHCVSKLLDAELIKSEYGAEYGFDASMWYRIVEE